MSARIDWKFVAKIVLILILAVLVGIVAVSAVNADRPNHSGSNHGNGRPPSHAKGYVDRNDPDDDSHGPDRGDGTRDDTDHNNGCGNDSDRSDDCEGWCGRPRTPERPARPPEPIIIISPKPPKEWKTCKLVLWGETPEVFPAGIDVHNGANEVFMIAEAHYYLEVTLPWGFEGTVLWYRGNHATSAAQSFVCGDGELVLWEPGSLASLIE